LRGLGRFSTIGAMLLQQAVNALTLGSLYALIAIGLAITFSIADAERDVPGGPPRHGARAGWAGA
jgi:hypothetical protein